MLDIVQLQGALECEAGVIRLFGAADIGMRGLLSGWSDPEEGHSWNDGPETVLAISVRPPLERFSLVVTGEPYVTRGRPLQDVTLYGNGHRLDFWRLANRSETPLTVILEPEWWFVRNRLANMTLRFHLPSSARPKELNDGQDGREIGFCFRSICLRLLHA
jgi:hypothetical protein